MKTTWKKNGIGFFVMILLLSAFGWSMNVYAASSSYSVSGSSYIDGKASKSWKTLDKGKAYLRVNSLDGKGTPYFKLKRMITIGIDKSYGEIKVTKKGTFKFPNNVDKNDNRYYLVVNVSGGKMSSSGSVLN
ncbi:hypothetical protein BMT55_07160 [Listeria newyorkensis]|uniref:Uncharacterized protein n=1 Tax=Listeria newyorkensis TaxID=1497681 RepID=A0ABX4XP13_9LIST|nr:hypothetical protein [Listeria newyorkensis]KGL38760.1 hypothetical protein EP58_15105 [Listeria newyorkensis]KMT58614.1 hypothetical protein X559_2980 [Listeria newyorkensis]PNP92731.1 hypothetical protein BMT55_07160 [Listeria newyorkensis]WAO23075.1 hypothetical protein OTR81_07360 [Listeria newyorkensis]SQC57030.1 Uncharacterised protein [Listeria newyorkensis]